ncbi:MAG: putative nonstructural protein [hymenopteran phasma-related virus OKIAV228]|uniref:putative nonstructural protein n=1 Tax=hymenopteran phasma-related virus OKIAV228 TaxID=2847800 RepID=UPI002484170C|nr:MAG: putative nonstructural protein [hymenopteran phasma-related virus OKIAV228]WBM84622.1 MAG: putative nonstructural protein [hymenopteran phasma-related virus OKIAV228]
MYYEIHLTFTDNNTEFIVEIEKESTKRYITSYEICSCGVPFNVPTIEYLEDNCKFHALVKSNLSERKTIRFNILNVNDNLYINLKLGELTSDILEIRHIFEYSLYRYLELNPIELSYNFICDYGEL